MMKLGIFAKTFLGTDPLSVLQQAKQAGYSTVQYNMACSGLGAMPDDIPQSVALAISHAAQATGVEISAVSGTYNMIHPDHAVRKAGLRRLEVLASRCSALGTRLITLCTGTRDALDPWKSHPANASSDAWVDLTQAMARVLAIAEKHQIDVGVEPELGNVVNSAEKALQLIGEMKSPRLKIILDPANLFEKASLAEQRSIVSSAIENLRPHIALAHAKDRNADGSFTTAGKGVLDYPHYLKALKAAGFGGSLITHGLRNNEAKGVARFLQETLSTI